MGIHMLLRSLTPSLSRPPAFQLLRPLVLGLTARAVGPRRLLQQSHKHYFGGGFERAKKNTGSEYRGKIKRKNESSTTHQHRAPSYVKGGRVLDRTTGNTFNPDKQSFENDLQQGNIVAVFSRYPSAKQYLQPTGTFALTRLLHTFIRKAKEDSDKEWLLDFANAIVRDLKNGSLAPHTEASKHLLSIFREAGKFAEGQTFWNWLVQQDSRHASAKTWGAGIELLAYAGSPLTNLEYLFKEALERFPVPFVEYHLAPNAVLPDRDLPFPSIKGISLGLLQGIITARLLHGDLKGAYMALDTSFRIMPTAIPKEIFRVFSKERPLAEKYKIFMMACRSRNVPYPSMLQNILEDMLAETRSTPYSQDHIERLIQRIGASLRALMVYIAVGGKLDEGHVNSVLSLLNRLMRRPPLDAYPAWTQYNNEVFRSADSVLGSLLPFIDRPALTSHHGLMSLAPQTGDFDRVLQTLQKLQDRGRTPNYKTYRLIVRLAGVCQDVAHIKSAWEMLIKDAEASKRTPDQQDRHALIGAAISSRGSTEAFDYLQAEARRLKWDPIIMPEIKEYRTVETPQVSFLDLSNSLRTVLEMALNIPEGYYTELDIFYSHPMNTSIDSTSDLGPKEEFRKMYDQLTTDPSLPQTEFVKIAPGTGEPGKVIYDGIPLGELRFENWVTITELLALAERQSLLKDKIIDEAIEQNLPVSHVTSYRLRETGDFAEDTNGVDCDEKSGSNAVSPNVKTGKELRDYVYHLRGLQ